MLVTMRALVFVAITSVIVWSASDVAAKDPCPPTPPDDERACVALVEQTKLHFEGETGLIGADEDLLYAFQKNRDAPTSIVKLPWTGGASTIVVADVGERLPGDSFSDHALIVSRTNLYWSTLDGIFTVPKRGGEIATLYDAAQRELKVFDLTFDGEHLYWANSAREIWQMSVATKTTKKLVRRGHAIEHLTVAGGHLVWVEPDTRPQLISLHIKTKALRSYALDEEAFDVAADDRFIYVGTMHALLKMPLAGAAFATLVKGSAEKIFARPPAIYFIPYEGNCGGGHLMKVATAGGSAVEVEKCPSIRNLIVHDRRLYFVGPRGSISPSQ
jgi:hypothetical protein